MGRNVKHGQSGKNRTKEYIVWGNIIDRCYNPNHKYFSEYGGRGIIMCASWRNRFEAFLSDIGLAPTPKHTIERINVNGNYEPDNCDWVTQKVQCNNKRNNLVITYKGISKTLTEWCESLNLHYAKVWHHLKAGKSLDYIIENYHQLPSKKAINRGEVIVIKALLDEGIYYRAIAKELMIDHQTVWRIWRNKCFKNTAA